MITATAKIQAKNKVTGPDTKDIWYGITEGNEHALSKLFCLYYQPLFDYGYKIVPARELVKDSIQELFLKLWEQRYRLTEAYSVRSYLFTSLRRMILRKLQKQRSGYERNRKYVENCLEGSSNTEEQMVRFEAQKVQHTYVTRAIEQLSKRQKEAVYLKFYKGCSNKEIALIMNINRQSVYNHISEAIDNLQALIRN